MMLIGIVKKNAIMQIDCALDIERRLGKTPAEAIYEGCLIRFRPIMMTTMSALLGALPMSLGYGSGGEARRPLGLAVAGGLVFSQMMTLYLTPVVYTYMSGATKRISDFGCRISGELSQSPALATFTDVAIPGALSQPLALAMFTESPEIRNPKSEIQAREVSP